MPHGCYVLTTADLNELRRKERLSVWRECIQLQGSNQLQKDNPRCWWRGCLDELRSREASNSRPGHKHRAVTAEVIDSNQLCSSNSNAINVNRELRCLVYMQNSQSIIFNAAVLAARTWPPDPLGPTLLYSELYSMPSLCICLSHISTFYLFTLLFFLPLFLPDPRSAGMGPGYGRCLTFATYSTQALSKPILPPKLAAPS